MQVINKRIIVIFICLSVFIICLIYCMPKKDIKLEEVKLDLNYQNNNMLAIYTEEKKADGTYSYVEQQSDIFPTQGYVFNKEKSQCISIDGNILDNILSYENNRVIVDTSESVNCYLYFDKALHPILNLYKGDMTSIGDGYLIYHDGLGTYTNHEYEAGDNSYRFSGNNPDNFICLDGTEIEGSCDKSKMYRIIGLFPINENATDYQMKLIKSEYLTQEEIDTDGLEISTVAKETTHNDYTPRVEVSTKITAFLWSGTTSIDYNNWQASLLNKALNKDTGKYLNSLASYLNQIDDTNWYIGGNNTGKIITNTDMKAAYETELGKNKLTKTSGKYCTENSKTLVDCTDELLYQRNKIGLIYVTEYGYATFPSNWKDKLNDGIYESKDNRTQNWLYNGMWEYTLTRESGGNNYAYHISGFGDIHPNTVTQYWGVRPTFNLISTSEIINGDGTKDNPWRLKIK